MAGSITTLGLGSGLELQSILDQLKEVDQAAIKSKETQNKGLQGKIDAYNNVNAKLFNLKSNALSLSLESDFLKTSVSVTDEEILSATANDGIAAESFELNVTKKARYNSWQTVGVESETSPFYPAPQSGIASTEQSVTTTGQTYDILYGAAESQQTISVNVDSGQNLTQIAEAINDSENNKDDDGTRLVNASVEKNDDGEYYIRLSAVAGGDSVDEQVKLAGFDYIQADTTFSISRADNEDPMYVSLAPGATYADTVGAINEGTGNPGVTATLVDTGQGDEPYRLTLTSDDTGEKARITVSDNMPMTEINGADGDSLNAAFTVNGVEYQRQTNDAITDVISGVTLNLKKTGETTIGIRKDTEAVKENITALVENFNELLTTIAAESGDTTDIEDDTDAPLENDYAMTRMTSTLKNLFTTTVNLPSEFTSLMDIGLEVNQDGSLSLDEDELDQALAANADGVAALFIGNEDAGIKGLGDILNDGITDMVSSTGIVTTGIDEAEAKMTRLTEDIETATEQLDKRYETMAESFTRLDTYIQQLNAQSAYMESMIESFNKTTE
ncbi:flagellar filament capping protein FliD [Desulfobacter latus]|uniref:Flagellar hook-associated protein 2 n=1 Tax=Desulfobacter latus TaxID=2292 RepID=A0A850T8Z9_9BACT|nr:flagellar filament capping protein FliD [Desulfobacter latus]NWH04948.1 flagellar filament capping protein FliD [Desulfobacter latus]